MTYNWEEIFKEKTTRELFEIYSGHSMLPDSTKPFAKRELEERKFDFDDIEYNKEIWRVESIEEEQEYLISDLQRRVHFTLKTYLLFTLGLILFFLVFQKYFGVAKSSIPLFISIIIILTSLLALLDNYIYKRRTKQIEKLDFEKGMIIKRIKTHESLTGKSYFQNEIDRNKERIYKESIKRNKVLMIIALTLLAIYLFTKFIN